MFVGLTNSTSESGSERQVVVGCVPNFLTLDDVHTLNNTVGLTAQAGYFTYILY